MEVRAPQAKKPRAKNFTESEKALFIEDLLPKYRRFIECKKTDHITNAEKTQKWADLTADFNAQSNVHFRTVENLQNLWDNMKKSARAAANHEKKQIFQTGLYSSDSWERSLCSKLSDEY